jgi:hypothetical protein
MMSIFSYLCFLKKDSSYSNSLYNIQWIFQSFQSPYTKIVVSRQVQKFDFKVHNTLESYLNELCKAIYIIIFIMKLKNETQVPKSKLKYMCIVKKILITTPL